MTEEQFDRLIGAFTRVVEGRHFGSPGEDLSPTGFEALAYTLGCDETQYFRYPVGRGLHEIAVALGRIADSLESERA